MDASEIGGLKDDEDRSGKIGFLEFIRSAEVMLIKPIEVYVQYEQGYAHWVASFCPAAISVAADTAGDAVEELRKELVHVYKCMETGKELPEPWRFYHPELLRPLTEHLARSRANA